MQQRSRTESVDQASTRTRSGLLHVTWRRVLGLIVASVVLAAAVLASILIGNYSISVGDVIAAVSRPPETDLDRIIQHIRIPRTVAGLLAGVALGVAGTVMQGITRNPLAGPGILGINAGAGLAVVFAMTVFGITATSGYVWFAFAGAAIAAVFVYALGSLGLGGATPVKLALAGAAFTAFAGAITSAITLLDATTLDDFRFWVVGSLTRADGTSLAAVAPFITVGVVVAISTSRTLNVVALGDDMAQTLGTRLWSARLIAALAVVLLAGSATAIAGPIGFIGLVVPHIARLITGSDYRWIMAWTIVLAPAVLLLADVLGRILVAPQTLQVGIITGIAGAPFFLYLVRNRKVSGL
ncbi:FecCD family ABC transporter permease [Mycolicibacterium iranicum]|uniref:FecCD family ABC transporter permease n=1 Tax=Mycolicibacterium iranicum TaxID=912594 RepID=UPI001F299CF7|nr:iron chelate uptake ABC transporter family permease subunit [Mycolicibacterium iranicum]